MTECLESRFVEASDLLRASPRWTLFIHQKADGDAVGFYRALGFRVTDAPQDPRWPGVRRYRCERAEPGPALVERWERAHRSARMVGWDFSSLAGRMTMSAPPWDFREECLEALRDLAARALANREGA